MKVQGFYFTITLMSGRKHSDTGCLLHAPCNPPPENTVEEDAFLGAISAKIFSQQQRNDLDQIHLNDYIESKIIAFFEKHLGGAYADFVLDTTGS